MAMPRQVWWTDAAAMCIWFPEDRGRVVFVPYQRLPIMYGKHAGLSRAAYHLCRVQIHPTAIATNAKAQHIPLARD